MTVALLVWPLKHSPAYSISRWQWRDIRETVDTGTLIDAQLPGLVQQRYEHRVSLEDQKPKVKPILRGRAHSGRGRNSLKRGADRATIRQRGICHGRVSVRLSVRLSLVGILSEEQKTSSYKTTPQGIRGTLVFLCQTSWWNANAGTPILFSYAGPAAWNSLTADLRAIQELAAFRRRLKTHLFSSAFNTVY